MTQVDYIFISLILAMPLVIGIIGMAIFGAKKKPKEDNKSKIS